ncbi:MAG: GDSL-type esterase/lipase family protein [Myxococcota bacterium]|nr:GDSL-type esterase/lipase family protein [Myxococcota bacterium]
MASSLPLSRRIIYSGVMFVAFLALAEVVLTIIPTLAVSNSTAGLAEETAGTVVCVGDSVTAGVGVPAGQAWPDHLSLNLARHDVSVLRAATPGAQVRDGIAQATQLVTALPEDARPVVLVMLGHNDALRWDPGARRGFERHRRAAEPGDARTAAAWQPRIVRVARWVWTALADTGPFVRDDALAALPAVLAPLQAAAADRGGQVVLMTYLVPGQPPDGLDPALAEVISAARRAQAGVNAEIRRTAADEGLALIDLEDIVSVGAVWDLADFVDHIHLSSDSSVRVADVVYRRLKRSGALTP